MMKQANKSSSRTSSGFTLLELLVVLIILGLLGSMVLPRLMGQAEGAKVKAAKAQIQQLVNAVDTYYLDNGEAPRRLEDLVQAPGDAPNWNGPYVKPSLLKDPWHEAYVYRNPGDHGDFDILSFGPDKSAGGEGKNADINSWE